MSDNKIGKKELLNQRFTCLNTNETITGKEIFKKLILADEEAHNNKLKGLKKRKSRDLFKKLIDSELGTFNFSHYENVLKLFITDKGVFDGALAFRFIYLTTFMDFDNNLRWGKNFRNKNRGYMREKDLDEVLMLSRNQATKFKQALIGLDILFIDEETGLMKINTKLCHKGKIKNSLKKESTRVFEGGIQDMYKMSSSKEHKRLGIFIQLLPYLNIKHNILCLNVEESDPFNICPLTIQDICNITGYTIKNANRLERELLKSTVGNNPVMMKHIKYNSTMYSINPKVFYKGSSIEELEALITLFKIV